MLGLQSIYDKYGDDSFHFIEEIGEFESWIEYTITELKIPFYLESRVNKKIKKNEIAHYDYNGKSVSYRFHKFNLHCLSENLQKQIEIWLQTLGFVVKKYLDDELKESLKMVERKKRKQIQARTRELKNNQIDES